MFSHSCTEFNPPNALYGGTKIRESLKTSEISAQTCHPRHMSVMIHVNPPDACEMSALQTELPDAPRMHLVAGAYNFSSQTNSNGVVTSYKGSKIFV